MQSTTNNSNNVEPIIFKWWLVKSRCFTSLVHKVWKYIGATSQSIALQAYDGYDYNLAICRNATFQSIDFFLPTHPFRFLRLKVHRTFLPAGSAQSYFSEHSSPSLNDIQDPREYLSQCYLKMQSRRTNSQQCWTNHFKRMIGEIPMLCLPCPQVRQSYQGYFSEHSSPSY